MSGFKPKARQYSNPCHEKVMHVRCIASSPPEPSYNKLMEELMRNLRAEFWAMDANKKNDALNPAWSDPLQAEQAP